MRNRFLFIYKKYPYLHKPLNTLIVSTKHFLPLLVACVICASCSPKCRIVWTEGETDPDTGHATHILEILHAPKGCDWTIWFSQFRTPVEMAENSPATIAHVEGTLYRIVPEDASHSSDMKLVYEARPLVNHFRAPETFFLQKKGGKPVAVEVEYVFLPSEKPETFSYVPVETGVYDIIPQVKEVRMLEGTVDAGTTPSVKFVDGQVPGWYSIKISDGAINIAAADEEGAYYASVSLSRFIRNARGMALPCAEICDWPDLRFRGMMLDVSRNFTTKDNILRLIDMLASYKVNYFHLHFGDDEGWRVQIDSLPELTRYGAFRCIPVLNGDGTISEPDGLQPTYTIAASRDDKSSANGYYTHADFVEILRYAHERHIRVIPEFDLPGHSRAAIKSMEVRAAKTGDTSCLLSEAADTSRYNSVQDYDDNAINVALPSTYKFIETVFDALISYYAEACVPLPAIHIGGDEVPHGAWTGSPACRKILEEAGTDDIEYLNDYFLNRVLDIAEERGVKIAGWQEVCQHIAPETFTRLRKSLAEANLWTVSHGRDVLPYTFAAQDIPVVVSIAPNCYLDLAYNSDRTERGHSWAGFVDERRSYSLQPYDIYRSVRWDDGGKPVDLTSSDEGKPQLTAESKKNIIGVETHLWTETIRNFDHVTYYVFPKTLGVFERGWNANPSWAGTTSADDPEFVSGFNKFFSIIVNNEYPYYESLGISYHRH